MVRGRWYCQGKFQLQSKVQEQRRLKDSSRIWGNTLDLLILQHRMCRLDMEWLLWHRMDMNFLLDTVFSSQDPGKNIQVDMLILQTNPEGSA
jgi:hypothetical protein